MSLIWWGALLARLALSVIPGLSWDVNSHLAWSLALVHQGPATFYGSLWCDYPPGYLYVLWAMGLLDRWLMPSAAPGMWHYILLKIPPILADLGIGLLLVRWAREVGHGAAPRRVALWWLLNPAVWITSAVWGQADSVFTLWILLALYLLRRADAIGRISGAAFYSLALLTKPQAVLFAPLFSLWVWARGYRLIDVIQMACVAVVGIIVLAWPFTGMQPWDWLFRLYRTTAGYYHVTSANAFNAWALVGLWRPDSERWLGIPYVGWGLLMTAACVGWILWRIRRAPTLEAFALGGAALILSSFLWLTRMHERYAYYALPFLLLAAALTGPRGMRSMPGTQSPKSLRDFRGRRRVWWVYAVASAMLALNLMYVLVYYAPVRLSQPFPLGPLTKTLCEWPWLSRGIGLVMLGMWGLVMQELRRVTGGTRGQAWWGSRLGQALQPWWAAVRGHGRVEGVVAAGWFILALSLYLVRLGTPPVEHYDEVHHVKAARQIMRVRETTEWTHPHVGKLAMAASMGLLGERPFAWRLPETIAGSCTIALVYLLGACVGGSRAVGGLAALLLLSDGLQFVISRIGMIDVYVTCFSLLAYLICARSFVMTWQPTRRAWLALGAALGLALASKWIALYTYGAVLVFLAGAWWRARRRGDAAPECRGPVFALRIATFLILVPAIIYLLSYARYIQTGHSLSDLLHLQRSMWNYHARMSETHTYSSPWWSWPLILRPVWTYFHGLDNGRIEGIVLLGNPAVFWVGLPCLLVAAWWVVRRRGPGLAFIVTAFCFQYLPWGLSPRKLLFFHHFYSALPWVCLSTAVCLRRAWARPGLRWIVGAYLAAVVGLFWYFYPILSALPITDGAFRARMWFPRWI